MGYKKWFKILIALQIILLCLAGFEMTNDLYQLVLFVIGAFLILGGLYIRKHHRHHLLIALGLFSVMMSFLLTGVAWLNIGLTIFLLITFFTGKAKIPQNDKRPLAHYIDLQMTIPKDQHVAYRGKWFGDQHIGKDLYEWDDVVLNSALGDTVVDLGQTILRNGDNYIVLNKLIGDTKLIVPPGIGIHVKHQSLVGEVNFLEQRTEVRNNLMQFYSEDYDTATKRVHFLSTLMVGDLEVIVL